MEQSDTLLFVCDVFVALGVRVASVVAYKPRLAAVERRTFWRHFEYEELEMPPGYAVTQIELRQLKSLRTFLELGVLAEPKVTSGSAIVMADSVSRASSR
jgi:hypothetical protein